MIMKNLGWALLLAAITVGGVKTFAYADAHAEVETAQADDGSMIDLSNLDCRELLQMSGEQEDNTLIFMHGYMSGKNSELMVDVPALSDVTEQVRGYCIDHPDATLLSTFDRFR